MDNKNQVDIEEFNFESFVEEYLIRIIREECYNCVILRICGRQHTGPYICRCGNFIKK
jgi:hypothetical protein